MAVVALGGAAGAGLRVAATATLPAATGGVPVATFVVNVTGAFLLAALLALLLERGSSAGLARPLLATGLLGSYTTVSSVAVEVSLLARSGRWVVAGAYLAGTVAAGMVAALAGVVAVRRWSAAGGRGLGRQR